MWIFEMPIWIVNSKYPAMNTIEFDDSFGKFDRSHRIHIQTA